jgi:hypothetical protein
METLTTDPRRSPAKLGEELPVFCERCGYNLNGLPQVRCDQCAVLQFVCPECGHHQPINTLRPAAQRIIGRLRAVWLTWVVFFKLNYFGWLLFAWGALALESSYSYRYQQQVIATQGGQVVRAPQSRTLEPLPLAYAHFIVYGMFGLSFGLVSRMLLLRWRAGWKVGLVLAALVAGAIIVGVGLRGLDRQPQHFAPLPPGFPALIAYTGALIYLGAIIVWPIWVGIVRVFLPAQTGMLLLEWQRAQSSRSAAGISRE